MSYPTDIEDEPTHKLIKEIDNREHLHERGKCPYCKQPYKTHTCKFAGRENEFHKWPLPEHSKEHA